MLREKRVDWNGTAGLLSRDAELADVGVGSKTEMSRLARHVRFTFRSSHRQPASACRLVPLGDVLQPLRTGLPNPRNFGYQGESRSLGVDKVRVFIDESGSFSGFHAGSLSVVGALVIPDVMMEKIGKKYAKFRDKLPQESGEVKGRLLNEKQVGKVVTLLVRNEALFEITALDLGLHQENAVR
jgi:hypothetical protein